MTVVECDVAPVVENVFGIDVYAVPAVVEYLQVALSLVERERVVDVVPEGSAPLGAAFDLVGGVVSADGVLTEKEIM